MIRVEAAAAKSPGAKVLDDMPEYWNMDLQPHEITSKMIKYNRKWIHQQMKEGRTIIDLGPDPNRTVPSIFYQMERNMLKYYQKRYPEAITVIES